MKQILRRLPAAVIPLRLVLLLALPALAYSPNSSGTVTIPDGVTSLSSGSIPKTPENLVNVKNVYVPASVKSIGSGTFVGFINLRNVIIRGAPGSVKISPGAMTGQTRVVYTGTPPERTTEPATKPSVTTPNPQAIRNYSRTSSGNRHSSGTKAAGRWVGELQKQTGKNAEEQNQTETGRNEFPEPVTNEDGEVMVTIPGSEEKQRFDEGQQGTPALRALSYVLVAAASVGTGLLVKIKFFPKKK